MKVEIVRIAQEMDLEQDVTANFVHLRLPSGDVIRALIDDASVQAIVMNKVRYGAAPQPAITSTQAPAMMEEPQDELPGHSENGMMEFGGRGGDDAEPAELDDPLAEAFAPPVAPPPLRRPAPRPARKVQADEAGNPIMPGNGGVDADELVPRVGGMEAG